MIQNPIFPGFNPDPCICRKGEDYYVAVSTAPRFLLHWEAFSDPLPRRLSKHV